MGILGAFLLKSHLDTTTLVKKVESKKAALLSEQQFYFRMGQLFSGSVSYKIEEDKLMIEHPGGLDPEERFRGPLTSLLFKDKNQLFLYTWPASGEARKILFFDHVNTFTVQADPPEKPCAIIIKVNDKEYPFFL